LVGKEGGTAFSFFVSMGASFLRVELMGSVVPCGVKLCKHIFQQKFIDATKPA
jgi:hypothetical protein